MRITRTEQQIATVEAAGPEDVDRAVQAAQRALKHPSWKSMAPTDRGRLMARLADLIEDRRELLATIDAWDNGELAAHASARIVKAFLVLLGHGSITKFHPHHST